MSKKYDGDAEIIDVAYQTASDEELFRKQAADKKRQDDENEEALMELAREVMLDPDRCFCRNCGQPVYKSASVCVHCNYVLNQAALQQGQRLVRARRQKYEKGHKIFKFINDLTGLDFESDERKKLFEIHPHNYRYAATGKVYCTNCGTQVDENAAVCVNCNYVLNPLAVRRAQMQIQDKQAKVSKAELIKCALIPGRGRKMFKLWQQRRPQVAKPCRIAGWVNSGILSAAAVITLILIIFS